MSFFLNKRNKNGNLCLENLSNSNWTDLFVGDMRQRWRLFPFGLVTSVLLCSSEDQPRAVTIVALTVLCWRVFIWSLNHYFWNWMVQTSGPGLCRILQNVVYIITAWWRGKSCCGISESCYQISKLGLAAVLFICYVCSYIQSTWNHCLWWYPAIALKLGE